MLPAVIQVPVGNWFVSVVSALFMLLALFIDCVMLMHALASVLWFLLTPMHPTGKHCAFDALRSSHGCEQDNLFLVVSCQPPFAGS